MKMFNLFLLFLCFPPFQVSCDVIVVTKLGLVEGVGYLLGNGKVIYAFLGVPYAMPPIGSYRFEEPTPVKKWEGTWKAKTSGSACLQLGSTIKGSEDCLYLDIYTPSVSRSSLFPVMVFIHGGSFKVGAGGIYNPRYLMNQTDFIFVTINYRLGPFGFLSTEDSVVPGNNGLKDQMVALKWIQDNIESFGGDNNKVTVVGHSAGAASVHLHYLSHLSQGLFRNGISVSGTALNPWALTENPLQKARILAESVGCSITPTLHMVRCLKQRPGEHFFRNFSSMFTPWHDNPFSPFGPVIERAGYNPFLKENPYHLLSKGRVQDKPWLVSVTTEEGLYPGAFFIENEESIADLKRNWDKVAPLLLDYNNTVLSNDAELVSEMVKKVYFGEEGQVNDSDKIIQMLSERHFKSGIGEAAIMQASATKSPVFLYSIGYIFNTSFSDHFTKRKYGVSHGDDIINIFSSRQEKEDKAMSLILKNIWISFMKYSIPSSGLAISWEPMSRSYNNSIRYLNTISPENMAMAEEADFGNQRFWNSLGLNDNGNYNSTVLGITSSNGNTLAVTLFIVCANTITSIISITFHPF